MPDRIRFHLDEHVDPDVARALRRYGTEVTTTLEAGLRTQSDAAQWAYAMTEQRVLVTHDADFLRLASRGEDHPGVAFCGKTTRTVGEMVRRLILVYEVLTPEDIRGRIEFL
jgi:predicted nuclease of predicted toxin-antitoxin system